MYTDKLKRSLTIIDSPIEFVVIGAKGKRNGVLVRSQNVQLDLIGVAAGGGENIRSRLIYERLLHITLITILLIDGVSSRTINYVESSSSDYVSGDRDKRQSEYRFYWVGSCPRSRRKVIDATFNRYITDVLSGIEEGDVEQVEWSISPTILECLNAQAHYIRIRQQYLFIVAIYALIILIAVVTSLARQILFSKGFWSGG
jgi:hypothetical protein